MQPSTQDIADLISRCAMRDRAAFRTLYERTSAKLFGVVLRILKDRSEAEEAIQEIYVKVWQRADRCPPISTRLSKFPMPAPRRSGQPRTATSAAGSSTAWARSIPSAPMRF